MLLQAAVPAGQHIDAASAAAVQQRVMEHLPRVNVVILGRCFLVWAEQLQHTAQQAPSGSNETPSAAREQQQGGAWEEYSAVRFCIPGWQAGDAAGTPPPCKLEELAASISASVGAVASPAAQTALAAAAGGDFQKCREQLEALSAAQARCGRV